LAPAHFFVIIDHAIFRARAHGKLKFVVGVSDGVKVLQVMALTGPNFPDEGRAARSA